MNEKGIQYKDLESYVVEDASKSKSTLELQVSSFFFLKNSLVDVA
jgi:hypothetical protein